MDSEKFLEIEKKYDLYHAEANGCNYWPYLRFELWNHIICAEKLGLGKAAPSAERAPGFWEKLGYLLRPLRVRGRTDILFFDHERRLKCGEYFECVYTDELSRRFEHTATLEKAFHGRHLGPTNTPNLLYYDRIQKIAALRRKLFVRLRPKRHRAIREEIRAAVTPALREMKEFYGCSFREDALIERMREYAEIIPGEKRALRRLLRRLSPRLAVVVVSYASSKMLFVETAKELGIPVVELQHGTIHEEHIAYRYAEGVRIKQFPDMMFLFSDFWKSRLRLPIDESALISVGYPYFEKQVASYRGKPRGDARYTILFISQITVGAYLAELAAALRALLPESGYRILFKLHPAETGSWKTSCPALCAPGIEVIDGNGESIYRCFAESDMQIGVYSTAVYEGLAFGLRTLLLKVGHYEVMQPLVDAGFASYITRAEDVPDAIAAPGDMRDAGEFWKTNALENIVAEIRRIDPQIRCKAAPEEG